MGFWVDLRIADKRSKAACFYSILFSLALESPSQCATYRFVFKFSCTMLQTPITPKPVLILLFAGFLSTVTFCQDTDFNNLLQTVSERSYIQVMRGNIPVRNQSTTTEIERSTFMEAQIAPNYLVRFGDSSRFALGLTPRIILRMADNESFPIKTPSFMPMLTLFHRLNADGLARAKFSKWLFKADHRLFLIYRLAHHSNGQKDDFFVPGTRRINFGTGNFTTDYCELGVQWLDPNKGANGFSINGRISFEQHFTATREEGLRELYYNQKLLLENEFNISKTLQLATRFDFMFGNGLRFESASAYQFSLEFQPFHRQSDLSFFLRAFGGPDYYNIRYFSDQRFLGLGIRANPKGKVAMRI
jgi:hypothetical protein